MAKKRKEASQSSTLHDFFGNAGNARKKPKTARAGQISAKRHKVAVKKESCVVDPADIIVIDSDGEEDSVTPVIELGSSSDAEFVEGSSAPLKSKGTKAKLGSSPTLNEPFGEPSLLLSSNDTFPSVSNDAFGEPSLLKSPQIRTSIQLPGSIELVASPFKHSSDDLPSCTLPDAIPALKSIAASQNDDDVWGTGDDEMAFVETDLAADLREEYLDAQETEADIDLTLDDNDEPATDEFLDETCPICNVVLLGLRGLDIQQHVNQCIDEGPGADSTKSLRPLSSIRAPSYSLVQNVKAASFPSVINNRGKGKARSNPDTSTAFSVLMTSHKENEAWKEASIAEDRSFRPNKGNGGRRKAPFYKVMTGMPIAVDAFRYGAIPGVTAYFLTHAHSDHYTNLSSNWKTGPIYCSEGTANLIIHMLSVDPRWVHPLPMDVPTVIPDTGGVQVTLIEANHCPGSSLFFFEGPQTVNAGDSTFKSSFVGSSRTFRYLHCGDFRASPQHVLHPAVKGKRIDTVYLDTTYLDPRYCFPSQPEVISACAELARRIVKRETINGNGGAGKVKTVDNWFAVQEKPKERESKGEKTLIVVGTYSIGKERIVKAIANALRTKVYCDARKTAILRCQSDPELHSLLTSDPYSAGVHLVPLGTIASDRLEIYIERWKGHFDRVVGFRPTGWTYSATNGSNTLPTIASVIARSQSRTFTYSNLTPMKNSTSTLSLYGVPYSEHSSFFELTCFALSFDWGRMIATVNVGSENSRGKMGKWVERWEAERKRRGKVEVVSYRAPDYW